MAKVERNEACVMAAITLENHLELGRCVHRDGARVGVAVRRRGHRLVERPVGLADGCRDRRTHLLSQPRRLGRGRESGANNQRATGRDDPPRTHLQKRLWARATPQSARMWRRRWPWRRRPGPLRRPHRTRRWPGRTHERPSPPPPPRSPAAPCAVVKQARLSRGAVQARVCPHDHLSRERPRAALKDAVQSGHPANREHLSSQRGSAHGADTRPLRRLDTSPRGVLHRVLRHVMCLVRQGLSWRAQHLRSLAGD